MANPFRPKQATSGETAVEPAISRPRMVLVIEALDNAYSWANQAAKYLAAMTLDVEQHSDKLGHFRDSLIKTMEQTGGDIGAAVEGQIREFVGNNQRRVEDNIADEPR
jgi:hypothetical protein